MRTLFLGILLLTVPITASEPVFWTFGPMLHFNFGKKWDGISLGFEVSRWTEIDPDAEDDPMLGWDIGVEFQREKSRIYSEVQYGFYAGASTGLYMELHESRPPDFGVQGSLWGALGVGADLRARIGTSGATFSPGLFAKVGLCQGYC